MHQQKVRVKKKGGDVNDWTSIGNWNYYFGVGTIN